MFHFINEFYLQDFEGHYELIFVYHYKDLETARLVQIFAHDSRIKGVAARDDGEFPSSTAMRFGAWSAADDVQVIAQWDFGKRHNPKRLSLQVHALAFSSRPACTLTQSQALAAGGIQEETLVGE